MRRALRWGGGTLVAAVAISALAPAAAPATVTCTQTGSTLDVDITAGGNLFPQFSTSGQNIVVTNFGTAVACAGGPPTLTNVDLITVDEVDPNLNSQVNIALPDGGFGPGATPEATGVSEIEFDVDLGGHTVQDSIGINTGISDSNDHFRFGVLSAGVNGANLNAPEPGGPDGDDVVMTGVESLNPTIGFSAETDANIVDATGGAPEFTAPLAAPTGVMNFNGTGGADRLAGGDQANFISADAGDDLVISGRGLDNADGDGGTDTISYERATAGVTVAINQAGADTGGGGFEDLATFENLTGGPFADNLTGTNDANHVVGAGGTDSLLLLDGNDTFNTLDQGPDTVDCGPGAADSGIADPLGVDTTTNCENVNRPPETTGAEGPALTNDPTPSFALTANEPATFEHRVDGAGGFTACGANCELAALTDGAHQVEFRAIDPTPLTEQTPVTRGVTVDTAAPDTTIDSGPADGTPVDTRSATYGFSSEAGASFQCSIDGSPFQPCASPLELTGLSDGAHAIEVRATDAAGNADPSPARRTLTVDTPEPADGDPPESVITKVKVKGDRATVRFSADEALASFACKLDRRRFRPCVSPKVYRDLDEGKHRFGVRATDVAGNADPTAARKRFEVG